MPVFVTRCSNLYGAGDTNFSRVIPNNIRKVLNGESPVIWKGSEKAIREFLYIDDAVDAYLSLTSNIETTKGNAYNIGSGEKISIGDLIDLILSNVDNNIDIDYREKDFPEISHQYLDSTSIYNDIGWRPKVDLNNGIVKTIEEYKRLIS